MKFGSIVLQVNTIDWPSPSRIFDTTSCFQDGGHDIRPPRAAAHTAVSAGCLLAHAARETSLARYMR